MLIERQGVSSKYTYTDDGINQVDINIPRKKINDVLLSLIAIGIVPKNIVEPFQKHNALQLSFMALFLGIFLLINKSKTETVVKFFSELNLRIWIFPLPFSRFFTK